MLQSHQYTRCWQNMKLIASMHHYFFGLHQALSCLAARAQRLLWLARADIESQDSSATETELKFGVNQIDVSPSSCRSAQHACPGPHRNLCPCTFVPQTEQSCTLFSFQCKQLLSSSCSTFPQLLRTTSTTHSSAQAAGALS